MGDVCIVCGGEGCVRENHEVAERANARIGDIVLYRSHGTRDGRHKPAHLPMMVVEVHDGVTVRDDEDVAVPGFLVSGWVYYVDGLRYHDRVPYSDDETQRATWFPREAP